MSFFLQVNYFVIILAMLSPMSLKLFQHYDTMNEYEINLKRLCVRTDTLQLSFH